MVIAIFKAGKFIDNIFIYCRLIFIDTKQSNAVKTPNVARVVRQFVRNTREAFFHPIQRV